MNEGGSYELSTLYELSSLWEYHGLQKILRLRRAFLGMGMLFLQRDH
jgi:hypothetical protein